MYIFYLITFDSLQAVFFSFHIFIFCCSFKSALLTQNNSYTIDYPLKFFCVWNMQRLNHLNNRNKTGSLCFVHSDRRGMCSCVISTSARAPS